MVQRIEDVSFTEIKTIKIICNYFLQFKTNKFRLIFVKVVFNERQDYLHANVSGQSKATSHKVDPYTQV